MTILQIPKIPEIIVGIIIVISIVAIPFLKILLFGVALTCMHGFVTGGKRPFQKQSRQQVSKVQDFGREDFTETDLRQFCDQNPIFGGGSKSERLCRAAFAKILYQTFPESPLNIFPSAKPEWLKYVTTSGSTIQLELDGLSAAPIKLNKRDVRLAFEYDGPQHVSFDSYCKMNNRPPNSAMVLDYYRQRFYDMIKDDLCTQNKVKLIRIADTDHRNILHAVFRALADLWLESSESELSSSAKNSQRHGSLTMMDDVETIRALKMSNSLDMRNSNNFMSLMFDGEQLRVASRDWNPHPYLDRSSLYYRLFLEDLNKFTNHILTRYIVEKYPRNEATSLRAYLSLQIDHAMNVAESGMIKEQAHAIRNALTGMIPKIVRACCVL